MDLTYLRDSIEPNEETRYADHQPYCDANPASEDQPEKRRPDRDRYDKCEWERMLLVVRVDVLPTDLTTDVKSLRDMYVVRLAMIAAARTWSGVIGRQPVAAAGTCHTIVLCVAHET